MPGIEQSGLESKRGTVLRVANPNILLREGWAKIRSAVDSKHSNSSRSEH